ncbi:MULTISPECIES: hypothetical protein [Agrobacterium]|uniref:Uncharacterized protein n=1 Tax=Agrobacterium larrymoorei TaxID=160699 RepID=A0AAJ2B6F2_9HYPH|nr:hypothetical protein [Agrobacterium larrymoorei]MDQ1184057.1 hypothetical protein [Agrobacterium larrymoorei]MDQ1194762.1 hypothetical protein [Rhizobium sp. SORGH_AS_0787]MDR6100184.1 hypothetical protein [Agrobacterium larrymoorei]
MARIFVIGAPGESGLWVADLDAGTVKPFQPPAGSALEAATKLRAGGAAIIKGVDFAVAVKSADDAFSGHLDG